MPLTAHDSVQRLARPADGVSRVMAPIEKTIVRGTRERAQLLESNFIGHAPFIRS
jgi:hypothetical protein